MENAKQKAPKGYNKDLDKRVEIRVSEKQKKRLEDKAKKKGLSLSAYLRKLITK